MPYLSIYEIGSSEPSVLYHTQGCATTPLSDVLGFVS